jgi:hypothetical protein
VAALVAAVTNLHQSQQRLGQAEAALASAEQLRRVAPVPQRATRTAPRRPKNATDLAAMSFGSKPFRVRPSNATTAAMKKAAAAVEELGFSSKAGL